MSKPELKQSLGVRDVVLFNVVAIVGLRWVALAASAFVLVGAVLYARNR